MRKTTPIWHRLFYQIFIARCVRKKLSCRITELALPISKQGVDSLRAERCWCVFTCVTEPAPVECANCYYYANERAAAVRVREREIGGLHSSLTPAIKLGANARRHQLRLAPQRGICAGIRCSRQHPYRAAMVDNELKADADWKICGRNFRSNCIFIRPLKVWFKNCMMPPMTFQ